MVKMVCIVPARMKSSRLPGKPLRLIQGNSMISTVLNNASDIFKANLYCATDSKQIAQEVDEKGYKSIMTSSNHQNGTERIIEALEHLPEVEWVINLQGDEPMMTSDYIQHFISNVDFSNTNVVYNGMCAATAEEAESLHSPKVVVDSEDNLLYMSRSRIPNNAKSHDSVEYLKQACIYAFPRVVLLDTMKNSRGQLEKSEDIEILRFLEQGVKIRMIRMPSPTQAVDTLSDLELVNQMLSE